MSSSRVAAPRLSPARNGLAAPPRREKRLLPEAAAGFLRRRMIEMLGLAVLAAGTALIAAQASYAPSDPSWNTAAPKDWSQVSNLLGVPGAYLADLLHQSLGAAAFALGGVVALWGIGLMRQHVPTRPSLRLVALLAGVLLAATALGGLVPGSGGSAGLILADLLARLVASLSGFYVPGVIGALLLLLALAALVWSLALPWAAVAASLVSLFTGSVATAQAAGRAATVSAGVAARVARWIGAKSAAAMPRREPSLDGEAAAETVPEPDPTLDVPAAIITKRSTPPAEVPVEPEAKKARGPAVVAAPPPKAVEKPKRGDTPRQAQLALSDTDFSLPPVDVLAQPEAKRGPLLDEGALRQNAELLEGVLDDFGVKGEIVKVSPGPVVTLYELEPAPGTKSSRVIGLADDIARSMSAVSVRVAVVPGRNVIGIELPNARRETVYLRELLEADQYDKAQHKLALVLGKDIGGQPIIADLARMPHLLVAGTTGSGKSVAINTMILSLLYRLGPERCRFIMVDPKMLELSVYEGIPHLLAPVVTEPKKAVVALKWAVREMEDRYRSMSKLGVRNIEGYNARLKEARENGETLTRRIQTGFDVDTGKPLFEDQPIDLRELPYIVVIVDEMADLMLVAGKDIEAAIQRLAQMARAAGIHLIMATQRPSVDVITGTIKANFPTRISFQVTSKIDSRTILGEQGAEQLLGQGDMLYMAGGGRITRVHGPFVRDQEVEEVVKFLKAQGEPAYVDAVTEDEEEQAAFLDGEGGGAAGGGSGDALYDQAVALVCRERKCSTSFIQRHLRIGYNSAARLVERMESEGVVSRANHVGKREVLGRDIDDPNS